MSEHKGSVNDAVIRAGSIEDAEVLATLGRQTFIDTFIDGFGFRIPPTT